MLQIGWTCEGKQGECDWPIESRGANTSTCLLFVFRTVRAVLLVSSTKWLYSSGYVWQYYHYGYFQQSSTAQGGEHFERTVR